MPINSGTKVKFSLTINRMEDITSIEKIAVIANGHIANYELMKEIVQEYDQFIAVDGGLRHCIKLGIAPVLLIGDMDSVTPADKKHFPTIKPDQLPEFMKKLEKASITMTTRNLIKFQLHSMARPSEAAGTRWEEIDFDEALCVACSIGDTGRRARRASQLRWPPTSSEVDDSQAT